MKGLVAVYARSQLPIIMIQVAVFRASFKLLTVIRGMPEISTGLSTCRTAHLHSCEPSTYYKLFLWCELQQFTPLA